MLRKIDPGEISEISLSLGFGALGGVQLGFGGHF